MAPRPGRAWHADAGQGRASVRRLVCGFQPPDHLLRATLIDGHRHQLLPIIERPVCALAIACNAPHVSSLLWWRARAVPPGPGAVLAAVAARTPFAEVLLAVVVRGAVAIPGAPLVAVPVHRHLMHGAVAVRRVGGLGRGRRRGRPVARRSGLRRRRGCRAGGAGCL